MNLIQIVTYPITSASRWLRRQWLAGQLFWVEEKLDEARWRYHQATQRTPMKSHPALCKLLAVSLKRRLIINKIENFKRG